MKNLEPNFFKSSSKTSKLESQYAGQDQQLDDYKKKIQKKLENKSEINEQDKIRLTRVLQLLEKYKPTRKIDESQKSLFDSLKSLYRFLPKRKTKEDDKNSNPYLLAEETVEALRNLRHYDYYLNENSGDLFDKSKVFDQQMSEKIISNEVLDTSLTLEYEKKNWGVDRICLDGIQNHLKTDSCGTGTWVQCLVDEQWVSVNEAKNNKEKIESVRFIDDGVGFDVKNLVLFWSTKSQEKDSKGQFGEGMKMVAAASLREGLDMEMQSQNWSARPFGKKIDVQNTRKNTTEKVEQLAFDVNHYDQDNIIGSRTIFHQPSKKFIDEVLKIEDKVLELEEKYSPLFVGKRGQIVRKTEGDIFVKGIFVKNENTLFSYNFDDVETNRDRNSIVNERIDSRVSSIIEELNDKHLIKTLLQKSLDNHNALECSYYQSTNYPFLWGEAFYEAFGKDACVNTNFTPPEIFKENKAVKITFPEGITKLLIKAGVKTDKETIPAYYEETIPTSITLEYGKEIWGEERIMLDAIQNHLPQDAEGGTIYLRFKVKDGEWHSFEDLNNFKNEEIETIKIANQGSTGYDHRLLGIFQSMKDHDNSSGKWGEGLKMLSAACLRGGIDMSLKSRKWRAIPKIQEQEIDDKKIEQLVFKIVHEIKNGTIEDDDKHSYYEQSATTFNNPSERLLEEFKNAPKKVLSIESKRPITITSTGELLRLTGGELFVRDILIPGEHNLRYSYHFPKFSIKTRDRNAITSGDLQGELSNIWSEIDKPDVIKDFLYQATLSAKSGDNTENIEFQTYFNPKKPQLWVAAYEEIFGKGTALRNVQSQNFNEMHQLEHVGLKMVTMPGAIYRTLVNLTDGEGNKIPNYEDKIKEICDVDIIDSETLAPEEKKIIELLYKLDEFLPNSERNEIKIYTKKFPGQDVALGFTNGHEVNLLRDLLSDLVSAVDIYYHEKTHVISGAADAEAGFRNFLTRALATLAIKQIEEKN